MRHSSKASAKSNKDLFRFRGLAPERVFDRMPELRGREIEVRYRPRLTAWKGQLLSKSHKGDAVYAGCFLRKRQIVLDDGMLRTPRVLERIFVHEVFHFVWSRLGTPLRDSWHQLIESEVVRGARGDLGWSAESMKLSVSDEDRSTRSRRWKDYVCEAFCDTAGWYFGSANRYAEMTLGPEERSGRRAWFREHIGRRPLAV
jgi:hypothetical protein